MEGPANYIATNKIVLLSRPPSTPKSTASWLPQFRPKGLFFGKVGGGGDHLAIPFQRGRKGENDEGSGPSPVSLFLIRKSMDRCYVDQMILSELLLTFPQARLSGFRIRPFLAKKKRIPLSAARLSGGKWLEGIQEQDHEGETGREEEGAGRAEGKKKRRGRWMMRRGRGGEMGAGSPSRW